MQSCSVHHCVLLLLTLTFTTAPVAAAVCRVQAKLHQRATLTCEHECPGEAKWTLQRNRSVVFARCDQTSCSSVVKGYEMSHGQYKKGDLSLTITAAEYSMRNTYACECGGIDYAVWRLSIETVFSAVQVKHDGDLILDLTVPEPVEVIYTSSDSADGERICNVTQRSLQCKAEYTHRTSLRYPELTLRDVTHSDSGRYTIRDTKNKEDIRVYAVSVTAVFSAVQKNPGEDLILDLTVPEPVEVIYTSSDSADGERICNVTQHSLQCKAEYTHRTSLSYPELTLRDVTYSDSGRYTIRDTENKEDIRVYSVSVTGLTKGMTAGIVLLVLVLVLGIIGVIIYKWRAAEEKRRAAEEKCRAAKEEYMKAPTEYTDPEYTDPEYTDPEYREIRTSAELIYFGPEDREVENEEQAVYWQMRQLFNLLQYENLRRKDQFNPHTEQMESIEKNAEELGSKMEELKRKFEEVEKMIKDLEKRYRENREYKDRVESFCYRRRGDLELCRNLYKTIQTGSLLSGSGKLMKMMGLMEMVIENLERLRCSESLEPQSSLYTRVDSDLNRIKYWCKKKRDGLNRFKEERGDEENVKLMIDDTEALLSAWGKWCEDKEEELQQYKPKPVSAERSESEPLNHV